MIKKTRDRKAKVPYTCIRCSYNTANRTDMHKHLYNLKKICPGSENNIELTDVIKEHILQNRIYKIPKEKKNSTFIQNIQNNNTINNYIIKMDTIEKLTHYVNYNKIETIGIECDMEEKYIKEIKRLEGDKFGLHLKADELLEIIDNISSVSENFENFNVLYDSKMNKIKLYSRSWKPLLLEAGIKELVQVIQDSYLYEYEMYLLRKIYGNTVINIQERNDYKLSLEEYIKFIKVFDIQLYCLRKTDSDILNNNSNKYVIEEKTQKLYNDIDMKISEVNKIKKTVMDIVKKNSENNVNELNKKVVKLFNMDEEFKATLQF